MLKNDVLIVNGKKWEFAALLGLFIHQIFAYLHISVVYSTKAGLLNSRRNEKQSANAPFYTLNFVIFPFEW